MWSKAVAGGGLVVRKHIILQLENFGQQTSAQLKLFLSKH